MSWTLLSTELYRNRHSNGGVARANDIIAKHSIMVALLNILSIFMLVLNASKLKEYKH
jgi:hypothetical protein